MRDGVIADFDITEAMLRHFILSVHNRRALVRPRIIVSIPSGITQVERRAVRETVESAGAREIYLIEEPMAAAIGAGLPITEPISSMVVDIGGGTTEVAVISLAGIVYSKSVRVAGDKIDDEIVQYLKRKYSLLIGERSGELIKTTIGNAFPDPGQEVRTMEVKGRDLISGIPKIVEINSDEIREAIMEPISLIVDAIKDALENTPPELAGDIVDRGIVLTGGGALLKNIDLLIREETGLPDHDRGRSPLHGGQRRRHRPGSAGCPQRGDVSGIGMHVNPQKIPIHRGGGRSADRLSDHPFLQRRPAVRNRAPAGRWCWKRPRLSKMRSISRSRACTMPGNGISSSSVWRMKTGGSGMRRPS